MRRATRPLLSILSILSLLACAGVCTLWARSYLDAESFVYTKRAETPGRRWDRAWLLSGDHGLVEFTLITAERTWDPARDRPLARLKPGFEHWSARNGYIIKFSSAQSRGDPVWARLGFRSSFEAVQDAKRHSTYRRYMWPHWFAAVLTIPLPAVQLLAWRRRRTSRRWQRAGRCAACGYDLRFTPGPCSECGAMMPAGFGPGLSIKRVARAGVLASALVALPLGGFCLHREWVRRHNDPLAPIARFSFDVDDADASGFGAQIERKNVPLEDGALAINGFYEHGSASPPGYRAVIEVPQLDYNAFTVIWRFRCAQTMASGQWNLLTGGTGYRWMCLSRNISWRMNIDFNNGDTAAQEIEGAEMVPDRWYQAAVSVDVKQRRGFVMLDGHKVADLKLPPDFKLSVVGSDAERTDRQLTFTNYSNGKSFAGQVDEIIVFPRALAERDLAPYWRLDATSTSASTTPNASPQR